MTDYFYLDSKGNITVAGGENVDDYNTFMNINSLKENRFAYDSEKSSAYNILKRQQQEGNYGLGYPAIYYKTLTPLRISQTTADELMNKHLKNAIQSLQKTFSDFNTFPLPLQEVLTDIHYNTGNVSPMNWPNLHRSIKTKNIPLIANNVHRKDVQKSRNDWALERINAIISW